MLRHSFADHVHVSLCRAKRFEVLEVADDGVGFDPVVARKQGGGLGLRGMEERVSRLGGKLILDSAPGDGTRVRVEVNA